MKPVYAISIAAVVVLLVVCVLLAVLLARGRVSSGAPFGSWKQLLPYNTTVSGVPVHLTIPKINDRTPNATPTPRPYLGTFSDASLNNVSGSPTPAAFRKLFEDKWALIQQVYPDAHYVLAYRDFRTVYFDVFSKNLQLSDNYYGLSGCANSGAGTYSYSGAAVSGQPWKCAQKPGGSGAGSVVAYSALPIFGLYTRDASETLAPVWGS